MNILTEQGYSVHPANEGELGLQFVKHTLPDLVLVDIRMPGMDGYQVCASLKDDPTTRAIPVMFISSIDQSIDKVKAFRSGAVDYVTKPFDAEEVLARIDTHISLHRLRENLESSVRERTAELRTSEAHLAEAQRLSHTGSWVWRVPGRDALQACLLGKNGCSAFIRRIEPSGKAHSIEQ